MVATLPPDSFPAVQRRARPSPPPPPILFGRGQRFEGFDVLDEIPGALGGVLWQALRDVTLWTAVPPRGRERLFAPGARRRRAAALDLAPAEPGVESVLRALSVVLSHPEAATPRSLRLCCAEISRWAEKGGALGTALAFMQAAALIADESAEAAFQTGRLAAVRGETARAEAWCRRAVVLARRQRDRVSRWRAYVLLARLAGLGGRDDEAARMHELAARAAERIRPRGAGEVLHAPPWS